MIRYIELAPSPDIAFQSGRIVRVLVAEGENIEIGSVLFEVDAQGKKAEVLASKAGKVNELIVGTDDVIHKLSSLLVLETIVEDTRKQEAVKSSNAEPNTPDKTPNQTKKKPKEFKQTSDKKKSKAQKKNTKKKTKNTTQKKVDDDKQSSLDFDQLNANDAHELINTQEDKTTMNEIKVPDLGGAEAVEVIDILVNIGDSINTDDPLMTVESDKASMDIPAPSSGTIEEIVIQVGDSISEGDVVFKISGDSETNSTSEKAANTPDKPISEPIKASSKGTPQVAPSELEITIPDLGGASDVDIIELLVNVGDSVKADQPLITVESDKASMDVPSSHAGVITSISVAVGDQVNEGDAIVVLSSTSTTSDSQTPTPEKKPTKQKALKETVAPANETAEQQAASTNSGPSHASPSVRRLARELGVDLAKVTGTSRKNRITKADVKAFVKGALTNSGGTQQTTTTNGAGIPEVPAQDFSKFGEIDIQALNKIKRITAQHLHRSWLNIPHVTHNDETNIQSLEDFRKTLNEEYAKQNKSIKLSPLAFIVKAVVNALQNYPQFNSSLENGGNNLIIKKYFNIGIAVETPNGLVVPVIRDADKLSVAEIAVAMGDLAKKARDGKLAPKDMQGGTFSISSLGGIGGTSFTPIVNAPEVAILGVSRTKIKPVWNGTEFIPAPILPLSLSYDHRVIDGAEAARFTRHIAVALEDIRRLTV